MFLLYLRLWDLKGKEVVKNISVFEAKPFTLLHFILSAADTWTAKNGKEVISYPRDRP
jgi:hypothetical protein